MATERFGKSQHVRRGWEYKRIYRKGKRFHHPALTLVVYRRQEDKASKGVVPQGETMRLGLSVSRKVDKASVGRNRLKRRLRELFRRGRAGLAPGLDLVFVPRPGSSKLSFADLESAFTTLCQKAGLQR